MPVDFEYAHQLKQPIRLLCLARQSDEGLLLSVRPSLIPQSTILAQVHGAYNRFGFAEFMERTRSTMAGRGLEADRSRVVSDLMRVAREIRHAVRSA